MESSTVDTAADRSKLPDVQVGLDSVFMGRMNLHSVIYSATAALETRHVVLSYQK